MPISYTESHSRSLAKAISWRVLGTLVTALLVYAFTRRLVLSLAVGGLEFAGKILLFWVHERAWVHVPFGKHDRQSAVIWLTGLPSAGKTTIAEWLAPALRSQGYRVEHLDGDRVRDLFPHTGFTRPQREEHVRRIGHLASRLERHGVCVVVSAISPYSASRDFVRQLCARYIEVYVATPLDECERRDVKGLYARARRGEITHFTGVDDPYEPPVNADVVVDTRGIAIAEAGDRVLQCFHRTNGRTRSR